MTDCVVAVSLEHDELLAIRASREGEGLRVESVVRLAVAGAAEDRQEVRAELDTLGLVGHPTVLVVPSRGAFVCLHRPGVQDGKALRGTIRDEIEDRLPVPMDGMAVDFDLVSDGGEEGLEVLAAAVAEEELNRQLKTLEAIGLTPTQATIGGAALLNAYSLLCPAEERRNTLGIHFSRDAVDVLRMRDGRPQEMRSILTAPGGEEPGEDLPVLLRSSTLKAELGADLDAIYVSGCPEKADAAIGRLGRELTAPVERVDLTRAGAADLPDDQIDLLCEGGLPLVGAAADALGLKALLSLNLLPSRQQRDGWLVYLGTPVRAVAVLLAAVLVVWVAGGFALLSRTRAETEGAESELAALWHELHPGEAIPLDPVRTLRGELASAGRHGSISGAPAVLDGLRRLARSKGSVTYHRIRIAGGGMTVEGRAADYAGVDALMGRLGDAGEFEVGTPEMSGTGGGVRFRVELREAG